MSAACNYVGCTVGETGTCALERDPATCEHRIGNAAAAAADEPAEATAAGTSDVADGRAGIGAPVLEQPTSTSSFPSSRTLGPDVVSEMMASRYVTVVGILGDPESGKTACLVSLYLMIANAQLAGWGFADSWSMMAFEDIARGAREWNTGSPPEQMTVHTELSDDRRPGFLHLRLVRHADARRVDLALPDLPGEWTTSLTGTARMDRFEFLKAAQVIWIVVDGRALADKERRQGLILRVGQLGGRLKTLCGDAMPRVIVAATRRDAGELPEAVTTRLTSELAKRGVAASVLEVAPFSDTAEVRAGFGIDALIDATVGSAGAAPELWSDREPMANTRSFVSFRRDR